MLALHSSGVCRADTPTHLPRWETRVVPMPEFLEPVDPDEESGEDEQDNGLFDVDTPDTTATPHL